MITIAGGIILAVLFILFLPYILIGAGVIGLFMLLVMVFAAGHAPPPTPTVQKSPAVVKPVKKPAMPPLPCIDVRWIDQRGAQHYMCHPQERLEPLP